MTEEQPTGLAVFVFVPCERAKSGRAGDAVPAEGATGGREGGVGESGERRQQQLDSLFSRLACPPGLLRITTAVSVYE